MHTPNQQNIFNAPVWQDKLPSARIRAASDQPLPADRRARNGEQPTPPNRKHSTRRRTVLAAGWVDFDTDAIINERTRETGWSRSKVISTMLKESAQNDAFKRNQMILAPIIRQTMQAEFRAFTNRYLAVIARIAYKVEQIFSLLLNCLWLLLDKDDTTLHRMEIESEKSARVNSTRITAQVDEVIGRLKEAMEETP